MNSVHWSIKINNMAITQFNLDNNKIKILLVDDSEIIRERLSLLLKQISVPIIINEAKDTIETMKQLKALKQDIVILDIKLPGESGMELLKKIKRTNKSIHVIILTNFLLQQYRKRCIELGADYFLSKSNDFEQIPDIIQKLYSYSLSNIEEYHNG